MTSTLRVMIVDDERLAREGIATLLQADPTVEVVAVCDNGQSALAEIRARRPDLVFLDMQMPGLSGLDVLARLEPAERPAVIFVTAYDRHAVQAFELCAVDYLLKPFRDSRFRAAVERAREHIRRLRLGEVERQATTLLEHLRSIGAPATAATPAFPARLLFRSGAEHLVVETTELAWLEAQGNSVRLGIDGKVHQVREPLRSIEERLDPAVFIRTHRSFIVNARHVRRITPTLYGDHIVHTKDGARLRLSRTFRDRVPQLLAAAAGTSPL